MSATVDTLQLALEQRRLTAYLPCALESVPLLYLAGGNQDIFVITTGGSSND